MNVGMRVRKLREKKGLSLRKVAAKSNISASLLSQIETSKVDPSLSTLRKIAVTLGVPLFYFVMEDYDKPTMKVKKNEWRTVLFSDAKLRYDIIHSNPKKKMGIMIGFLGKGGATSKEPMSHSGEECLIILEGAMQVQIGEDLIELEKGDSLYFDSSVPHRLYNVQNHECKFYLIISPPKF